MKRSMLVSLAARSLLIACAVSSLHRRIVAAAAARWHTAAMANPLLLLPDFLLILSAGCVCRYTALDRPVWDAAERLVYYLLFPVLLFNSIVQEPAAARRRP